MKYSQLLGKTLRAVSKETQPRGNALLHQAGYIRESTAGRYYLLPLAMRVRDKICAVIESEMAKVGIQKIMSPLLHPMELWEESKRTAEVAFELMHIKDRRDRSFVLGGTAEEMMVDLVRKFELTHKDLPLCIFQFSQKFRDELRARGGLLRLREFLMKDAYSFHASKEDFEKYYESMSHTYVRIYRRLGLEVDVVAADNGYMGGDYCHEFVVQARAGESRYLVSEDGSYAAHEDIARFTREHMNRGEAALDLCTQTAVRGPSVQAGIALYNQPAWRQIKSIIYVTNSDETILVCMRGDLEVNETKLCKVIGCISVRLATEVEVGALGTVVGFVSPLKLAVRKIGDLSLETVINFYTGADEYQVDTLNVNFGRDFTVDVLADVVNAPESALAEQNAGRLVARTGIEVGNIFQLGTHYSERMKDCSYINASGERELYFMGCYGIGVDRTLATLAEIHQDEKGLTWPDSVAPFSVHLVSIGEDDQVRIESEQLYQVLVARGIDVLYDDRTVSAGVKFADADLIGIPHRVVVSKKTLARGTVEYKQRRNTVVEEVTVEALITAVAAKLPEMT